MKKEVFNYTKDYITGGALNFAAIVFGLIILCFFSIPIQYIKPLQTLWDSFLLFKIFYLSFAIFFSIFVWQKITGTYESNNAILIRYFLTFYLGIYLPFLFCQKSIKKWLAADAHHYFAFFIVVVPFVIFMLMMDES
ncbi:hypothetical protein ACFL35_09695 [Candidatus Riflebacteria bacterium]